MARTSRRHSYRKSRRWNPHDPAADRMVLSDIKRGKHSLDIDADIEMALDGGMLSPSVAAKARAFLYGKKKAKSSKRRSRKSTRRSTKSRKSSRKGKSRKSTRRSSKSSTKSSSRSTWVAKQKRLEMKARRKAKWYQAKKRMLDKRGGNSKSALNRALYHARGGRFASRNPRRRSHYRRW